MDQEIKNKINLISEMMSIYQTTVINETDNENIKLIKKDIINKKIELEDIRKKLNIELNRLYDNGSNEIDPEINQMRSVINEVNNLLEEIIPDILIYLESPHFEIQIENNVQDLLQQEAMVQTPVNESKIKDATKIENTPKIVDENITKIEPIKNELQLEKFKEEKSEGNLNEIQEVEMVQKETANVADINEPIVENNIENEEKNINKVEIQKEIIENKTKKEEKEITEIKDIVIQNDSNRKESKKIYTIKIKQPAEDYRNTASNIISNRIKNINSPENAIKKTYNAAENVMNNIIQTWSESKKE